MTRIEDGLSRLRSPRLWVPVLLAIVASGSGCSEVRGRKKIREGNQLFRDGKYPEAVQTFEQAQELLPNFWLLWLNKGLACRQLMIPGAKTAENEKAINCALEAFDKVKKLHDNAKDQRGDQMYVQTLFDGDRFEALAAMYNERLQKTPNDLLAINGLIQVYAKWNRVQDALKWYLKKAELEPQDPEAQYGVGVFLWQQLFQKGGGPEKAAFDPRPTSEELDRQAEAQAKAKQKNGKKDAKGKRGAKGKLGKDDAEPSSEPTRKAPQFTLDELAGAERIRLADTAISFLKKAIELRPKYSEAMTYLNLIYRQKSYAYFDKPAEWQNCINEAEHWRKEAAIAQGRVSATTNPSTPNAATAGASNDAGAGGAPTPAGQGGTAGTTPPAPSSKASTKKGGKP